MANRFARVARRFPRAVPTGPAAELAVKKAAARRAARARLTEVHARDPRTGVIRRGRVELSDDSAKVAIWLPHRAVSPNRGLWGGARGLVAAVKLAWAARIEAAVDATNPIRRLAPGGLYPTPASRVEWVPSPWRVKVTATRWVRYGHHFIPDRDNLNFAFKGLTDAVVGAGFLRDDTIAAIDFQPQQGISPDGLEWTSYEIDATYQGD